MAGGLDPLVMFWREWGITALVVLSLALQVILLVLAEIRRRKDSGVLQVIVWLAYMLADTTVIYVLGHMSVTRRSPEHDLMAFWAPFLLLHLGGQDNITAYSIEDNRLWLRHLQSFVVQVLAAAFVLYQSSIFAGGRLTMLSQATILMSVVGVVKYGERVWALMCASSSNLSGKNYLSFGRVHIEDRDGRIESLYEATTSMSETSRAHLLLNIPKHLLKGPLPLVALDMKVWGEWKEMYHVAEIQLSLMYDMFYSKAELIHTWYGYCIRLISLSATITALLLFRRFRDKDGYNYNKVDVVATYVLLVGAITLEITSALGVMFSTWTYRHIHYHRHFVLVCSTYLLSWPARLVRYAIRKVGGMPARYWSGSMGQYNFINMCSRSKDSRSSKIARWMGREDWWNTLVYTSSSVPVPEDFSQLLQDQVEKSVGVDKENPDHIQNSRGRAVLKKWGLLAWSVDTKLDESILVWHIATHVYLSWYEEKHPCLPHLAKVTEELSNYMIFLLAARPYMLPDNASRKKYIELCNKVINHLEYSSAEDLIRLIRVHGDALSARRVTVRYADTDEENGTINRASQLGTMLISKQLETLVPNMLELISQVWVEMLCYTGYQCRPDSHARQLSNGGEITTIAVLMVRYMESGFLRFPRINNQRRSAGLYSWWRCCLGLSNYVDLEPGRINTIN